MERVFYKLSLREVRLRLGDARGNNNLILCAISSDYSAIIENYGIYFLPLAKIEMKSDYSQSDEYKQRKKVFDGSLKKYNL